MDPTIILAIEPGSAERVARAGGRLARDLRGRVVPVHVRDDSPLVNSKIERERGRNRTIGDGRALRDEALEALPDHTRADAAVERGDAAQRLREVARELSAALIVTGTRGRGALSSAFFGSVTRQLAREAPCPVMIVPEAVSADADRRGSDRGGSSTIVAGMDGSEHSSRAAGLARRLADRLDGRLVIVPLEAVAGSPARVLDAISASEDARLIVIAERCCRDRRSAPSGSLATELPRLARCPVVVLPDRATGALDGFDTVAGRQAA